MENSISGRMDYKFQNLVHIIETEQFPKTTISTINSNFPDYRSTTVYRQ